MLLAATLALTCNGPCEGPGETKTGTRTSRTIVELEVDVQFANLVSLAATFPDAKIYGLDTDKSGLDLARRMIDFAYTTYSPRIHLMNANYAAYAEVLQNKADIVVVVAPRTYDPVFEGVGRFIRAGGQVEILPEAEGIKNDLKSQFITKNPFIRYVESVKDPSEYGVVQTSIGAPLTSIQFTKGAWELFVASW